MKPRRMPHETIKIVQSQFYFDEKYRGLVRHHWTGHRLNEEGGTGYKRKDGYISVFVNGKAWLMQRLVWVFYTGEDCLLFIDHIDKDRSNNAFDNLRPATNSQNLHNSLATSRNTSGFRGIYWNPTHSKWSARISVGRRRIFLGNFDTVELACAAYQAKSRELLGEYSAA